jgi:hypothetical protein
VLVLTANGSTTGTTAVRVDSSSPPPPSAESVEMSDTSSIFVSATGERRYTVVSAAPSTRESGMSLRSASERASACAIVLPDVSCFRE